MTTASLNRRLGQLVDQIEKLKLRAEALSIHASDEAKTVKRGGGKAKRVSKAKGNKKSTGRSNRIIGSKFEYRGGLIKFIEAAPGFKGKAKVLKSLTRGGKTIAKGKVITVALNSFYQKEAA